MKSSIKKIIVILLSTVFFVENFLAENFATDNPTLLDGPYKDYDFAKTYSNFNTNPTDVLQGKLCVIGDSFAFLFAENCKQKLSYIVHQGYNVHKINTELVDQVPKNHYKYAFIFMGPNDYMEQTDIYKFAIDLQEICNKFIDHDTIPILASYLDPDYNNNFAASIRDLEIPCAMYDLLIRDCAYRNNLPFVELDEVFKKYGRIEGDFIHPNKDMYPEVLPLLLEAINFNNAFKILLASKSNASYNK